MAVVAGWSATADRKYEAPSKARKLGL